MINGKDTPLKEEYFFWQKKKRKKLVNVIKIWYKKNYSGKIV